MQWFYETREGVQGPFDTRQIADISLQRHLDHCREWRLDGGRGRGLGRVKFTLSAEA
jgi:hypothetical protein